MIEFNNPRIRWYRTPLDKELLKDLSKRSDMLGFLQAGGHLILIIAAMCLAVWLQVNGHYWWLIPSAILYGLFMNFAHAATHELSHNTVFKTKKLNELFAVIYDVMLFSNTRKFWSSHKEHHRYTLHFPDDMEAIQPQDFKWRHMLRDSIINFNPNATWNKIVAAWKVARGDYTSEWDLHLLPAEKTQERRYISRVAMLSILVHALVWVVCLPLGLWVIPVLFTGYGQFGSFGMGICGATQHIGLEEKGNDFRTCCRTVIVNPLFRFLYWHMNYHIEHHMYAAVPCYRLGKLHKHIEHDLPPTPQGLVPAWLEINGILKQQAQNPSYRYVPPLPEGAGQAI